MMRQHWRLNSPAPLPSSEVQAFQPMPQLQAGVGQTCELVQSKHVGATAYGKQVCSRGIDA